MLSLYVYGYGRAVQLKQVGFDTGIRSMFYVYIYNIYMYMPADLGG